MNLSFPIVAMAALTTHASATADQRNVLAAGARADGGTDCTASFQAALDAAGAAGGGVVTVPAGRYRFDGNLVVPANVTLQGIFRVPPTPAAHALTNLPGSVLLTYAGRGSTSGPPFIRLAGNNAAVAGVLIAYPDWRQTDVPPVPYPPCVESHDTEDVGIQDCCLLNPYEAIQLVRAHRHLIRNVTGYPSRRGLYVDECYDIGRVENVHFWPFGVAYESENSFCKWVNTQGVAFEFARTDWQYVLNTFCFGYGIGYRFSQSRHGSCNGNFLGLGADSCQRAVLVEQVQPPGLLITNGEFVGRWGSTDSVCLEIGAEVEGKISLVNCSFWGPIDRCVWMRSAAGRFTASACHFVQWDTRGTGSPAIQLDAGRSIVQGCTFDLDGLHVRLDTNVASAILTANQASGGLQIDNRAGPRTQASVNEADPVQWTEEARLHYRIRLGEPGDGRYLREWHGPERSGHTWRWSTPHSQLLLPVVPARRYTLTLEAHVPKQALAPAAGLYLEGQCVVPLSTNTLLTADLPPAQADRLRLELRSAGWVPRQIVPGSNDPRTLGVQGFRITVRAEQPGPRLFDANTGRWSTD